MVFRGTEETVGRLVETYGELLLHLAASRLSSATDAEDAVQETFLYLLEHDVTFRDAGHEKAWLIRTTLHRARNLRKRAAARDLPLEEAELSAFLQEKCRKSCKITCKCRERMLYYMRCSLRYRRFLHDPPGEIALDSLVTFWNSMDWDALLTAVLRVGAVLLCLTVHETCHALAALALGDPTAKGQHRISLNPLHHIDWMGLAALLLLGFGWAKPVSVDMRYFRNPKRGMALTALAGPVSNLALAFLLLLGARALGAVSPTGSGWLLLFRFLVMAAQLSVGLGVFNLIPLPPLDGSKVLFALLPDEAYLKLMRYERYGFFLLWALILFGALDGFLSSAVAAVCNGMVNLLY